MIVLPSAVLVTRDYLLGIDELTDLVDERISTRSPNPAVLPYVLIQRVGGLPIEPRWFDVARVQVGCWGQTEVVADEVVRTTFAALVAMRDFENEDAQVAEVIPVLGIAWNPDSTRNPPTPRFTFDAEVYLHPAPVIS